MLEASAELDAEALALLEEDLRSPCTEEIAIFRAFARVVAEASDRFVILDTAPTGHTLLLIDSSEAYHREVMRNTTDTPSEVLELMPRLRHPEFTKVVIVTLAEATPISEARRLQADLGRAGIEPFAWVINQSFAQVATTDPVLRTRGANELPHIESVLSHAERVAIVPWVAVPPVGDGLGALLGPTGPCVPAALPTDVSTQLGGCCAPGTNCCEDAASPSGTADVQTAQTRRSAMTEYVYHCRDCNNTFNTEIDESNGEAPLTIECPKCDSPDAMKAFSTDATKPAGGCTPGGSCCC